MAQEIKRKNELEKERVNQELKQFISKSEQEMNEAKRQSHYIKEQTIEWDKDFKMRMQQIQLDGDHEKQLYQRKYVEAQNIIAEENERIR